MAERVGAVNIMALDFDDQTKEHRQISYVVLGVLLLVASALMFSTASQQHTSDVVPEAYHYKLSQSVDTKVDYVKNSFYKNGPGTDNSAYVTELTDTIANTFHYDFVGSKPASLSYSYNVKADVRGIYALRGSEEDISKVWSKEFELVPQTTEEGMTSSFSVKPTSKASIAEYKALIDQFKTALSLPLNSEVVISFTIRVKGTVDGTPFEDMRISTVTAPLDQQIYRLAVKYDKADSKQVVAAATQQNQATWDRYIWIVAVVVAAPGLGSIVYGLRKQIFKTPYQRELEKIYRYHDGIIIRASNPANLAGKNMVPVESFDDMLNLEEELKSPIVASPASDEATRFMIIHGDVVYVYLLGKLLIEDDESLADTDESVMKGHRHKK